MDKSRLLHLWKQYAQNVKANSGGFTGSILANCAPQLQADGTTIHVTFNNATNEVEFNRLSLELLDHLKSALNNGELLFETTVIVKEEKKVIYTTQEKYQHLVEQFPKLEEWKEKLGLELK